MVLWGWVAVLDPGNHKSKLASVLPHAYQLPRLHLLEGTQRWWFDLKLWNHAFSYQQVILRTWATLRSYSSKACPVAIYTCVSLFFGIIFTCTRLWDAFNLFAKLLFCCNSCFWTQARLCFKFFGVLILIFYSQKLQLHQKSTGKYQCCVSVHWQSDHIPSHRVHV